MSPAGQSTTGEAGAERCAAPSDAEAILAVRSGDRDAFGRLVEAYQGRLYPLALMITRDPAGAEEVVQDTFVRAYLRLELYDLRRPFYPWLATIAARLAQNWLRRGGREAKRLGPPVDGNRAATSAPEPVDAMITVQTGRRLWRAVAALPSGERTAVVLYYRDEMRVKDVARTLGVTSGTVKTLLYRARRRLRRMDLRAPRPVSKGEIE